MLPGRQSGCACPTTLRNLRRPAAWREIELAVLVLLVVCFYFSRLTDLTIRGEESRWARVAQEMLESGDWIVPCQQGAPFPDRPPLNSWAIILASKVTGQLDLLAARLPSATATLLTTLLVYLYGRGFLSRLGAFAAAAAYPTMAQVLQLGRLAESDSLLTLCLTGSLFAWHFGYVLRASPRSAWIGGYALAALAGMAKGPQGPVYFVVTTVVFLSLRRDWKFVFNRWHLAGVGAFSLIVGAWQLPFLLAVGPDAARAIWSEGGDLGLRFHYASLRQACGHWAAYPFQVFACTMPWSCMLLVTATRWFRSRMDEARPMAIFLATACAVALPTCWLPADSRPRYFMSLYPCLALLAGLAIQRCWESPRHDRWQASWDTFQRYGALLVVVLGGTLAAARLGGSNLYDMSRSVSVTLALVYALTGLAVAAVMLWARRSRGVLRAQVSVLAMAGFMGLSNCGIVMSLQSGASNDPSRAIAEVRELIPAGERLVSFGPVHHLFAWYYQDSIELCKVPDGRAPTDFSKSYFCYVVDPAFPVPEIPFPWHGVAEISCHRARTNHPLTKVVVGRRSATVPDAETRETRISASAVEEPATPATFLEIPATRE